MGRADELRAELAAAELDEKLIAAKASNMSAPKLRELKAEVRAARQAFREQREAEDAGDGAARPGPVRGSARANSTGGK